MMITSARLDGSLDIQVALADEVRPLAVLHLDVGELGIHRGGDVAGERPRRGRPHQERLLVASTQREAHKDGPMRDKLVTLVHLHLTQADRAARTPRHGVVATVYQAPLMTFLEETPDRVVVLL